MASISPRPTPIRASLTAAASRRSLARGQSALNIKQEGWQSRMWHFYHNLGAVHYGVNFKKNAASKVSYFAAEKPKNNDQDEEPVPTKNTRVIEAVQRLESRFGGIKQIMGEFMVHTNVPGEGYLVGVDGLEAEEWDVWSIEEVRASEFASFFLEPDKAEAGPNAFAARIWRPDPQDRSKADSPLRPVADQCDQLLLLDDSIKAAAQSRLAMGILLAPIELSFAATNPNNPNPIDAFQDELIDVLTIPIRETDSAARYAPGLVRGPAELLKEVRLLTFHREIDETFAGMREELTRAIAAGLDLPAEIILGKADLNHWTGWDIDESAFRDHVDPDIILIMDSITRGYLHPYLKEIGVPDPEKYLIWRDLSDLGLKPPTIPEAIELHAAGAVNDQYLRDLSGVPDEYIPEEPEPVAPVPEVPLFEPGPPVREDAVIVGAITTRPLTELAKIDRMLLARITEASEAGFNRVLERAGAKIRSHAKKDRAISATIDRIPNDQVTYTLGETLVRQLQITPQELVPDDSFDPLHKRLRTILAGAQAEVSSQLEKLTGEALPPDDRKREGAIVAFLAALSAFALNLLFKPQDPGPGEVGDSVIPAGMVVDLMTQASGGVPMASGGPSLQRGFATGQDTIEWLVSHGIRLASHRWEYGDASTRRQPFDPHKRLDGEEFSDWDDDKLATPASASWLNVGHMFPGDHFRCQCMTVPVIVEAAA